MDIEVTEDKVCRVIADPLYSRPQEGTIKVFTKNCYDIWDLSLEYEETAGTGRMSRIPPGRYIMEVVKMDYAGADANMTLRLQKKVIRARKTQGARRSERSANKRPSLNGGWSLVIDIPLASEGSNNLLELDMDLIKSRFWRFEEDLEVSAAKRLKATGDTSPTEELSRLPAEDMGHLR